MHGCYVRVKVRANERQQTEGGKGMETDAWSISILLLHIVLWDEIDSSWVDPTLMETLAMAEAAIENWQVVWVWVNGPVCGKPA